MQPTINSAGQALIKEFEQLRLFAYPDPASALARATRRTHGRRWGFESARTILPELPEAARNLSGAPWTIGWGNAQAVGPFDETTPEAAERSFQRKLRIFAAGVRQKLTRPANENQLASMVSLAFNIGLAAFWRSTVLRAHNRGDFGAAARAFSLWNKAGGQEMPGLIRRRAAESALYLTPVRVAVPLQRIERAELPPPARLDLPAPALERAAIPPPSFDLHLEPPEPPEPTEPLAPVDAESSLTRSPIVRASAAGGVAGIGLAAEGARAVAEIRYSLGDWLPWVLVIVLLGAAGVVVYQRVKQRRGGWA